MNALVTGGTRGIGRAIAEALHKKGVRVTVTGTSPNGKKVNGFDYRACEFGDNRKLDTFCEQIKKEKWDILVNNAGVNKIGPLEEYKTSDFLRIQQINVTAPFKLCQAVLQNMKINKYGRILNITSIFGVVSKENRSAYSASKFGLLGLSRALSLEVAPYNILVNCLAPGFIDTDMTRQILKKEGMELMKKKIPMKRFAKPEEIAAFAQFLVSKENTYMTGQNVIVDGGFTSE